MSQAPQKFSFDTEFDAKGGVAFAAPRPKRLFPAEEVERIRAAAYAEGERTALASVAAQHAGALDQIAAVCAQALPRLAEVAHEHRQSSAALSLACAKAIADAALAQFPQAPVRAALEALAREIDAQPRLVVTAEPALAEALQGMLDEAARAIGFEGAVIVKADSGFGRHAFVLDFGDGQAAFDPAAAVERVNQALEAALAAEGLHAEPLIPGSES
jgi:flagellar assembly protein FliH